MVTIQRIDKCLICEREFIAPDVEIDYKKNIQFNVIYCYKCVRKVIKNESH